MSSFNFLKRVLCFALLGFLLLLEVCPRRARGEISSPAPVVVVSTSMIRALVQDVVGDQFQILALLSPASCPGHFDLKPANARLIRKAELIISHPFQKAMLEILRQHVQGEERWLILPEEKSLTLPDQYLQMGRYLLSIFSGKFPKKRPLLEKQWLQRQSAISQIAEECRKKFSTSGAASFPLMASFRQQEFLEFWGFPLMGIFDVPGGTSMSTLKELIQRGRREKVRGIIGNLQSGDREAKLLAAKIQVPMVMLSNFPGGEPGMESYKDLLQVNSGKILGLMK